MHTTATALSFNIFIYAIQVKLNQVIISDGKRVSVLVKIQKLAEPMEIKPGLYKQDATIADNTGFIRLTLWQRDIGKLDQSKSYRLHNVVVKSFNATKYLTSPKAGLHSTPANDLDDVVCQADSSSLMDEIIQAAEVVGINNLVKFNICMKCNSTVDEVDSLVGTCMLQVHPNTVVGQMSSGMVCKAPPPQCRTNGDARAHSFPIHHSHNCRE